MIVCKNLILWHSLLLIKQITFLISKTCYINFKINFNFYKLYFTHLMSDDDYGAELDAMAQETEKKIDKKDKKQEAAKTGGKKSFLQSAIASAGSQ